LIISATPYRASFFGGGTDYPEWYMKHRGAVLSTTINQFCYIMVTELRAAPGINFKVLWSHHEAVSTAQEILHPIVREAVKMLGMEDESLAIVHYGDLPARAGMGSSSAFAVGLIKALLTYQGKESSKHGLMAHAIHLEQDILKDAVGSQDQTAVAYGGLNKITFSDKGIDVYSLSKSLRYWLEDKLMLFFLGESRLGTTIAGEIIESLRDKTEVLERMRDMVDEGIDLIQSDTDGFGRLMNEAWELKRSLASNISNTKVDGVYKSAMMAGALGGKLLGAGSTGFMLFYVPKEHQTTVKQALHQYTHVPFRFEDEGSRVIYNRR